MTFLLTIAIYLDKIAKIALLITKIVKILTKYSDFLNIFLAKKAFILPKVIDLN